MRLLDLVHSFCSISGLSFSLRPYLLCVIEISRNLLGPLEQIGNLLGR